MEVNMTLEGLKFMVLGMVTVFLFLLLLIVVLKIQKKLLDKYFPQKPLSATSVKSTGNVSKTGTEDEETIAVITAAITEFRKG